MRLVGHLILSASDDLATPDRHFANQLLDVERESRSARIGIDGRLYVTRSPANIIWYGGSVSMLKDVVHVRVVCGNFEVVDGALAAFKPQFVTGGISFDVQSAENDGDAAGD